MFFPVSWRKGRFVSLFSEYPIFQFLYKQVYQESDNQMYYPPVYLGDLVGVHVVKHKLSRNWFKLTSFILNSYIITVFNFFEYVSNPPSGNIVCSLKEYTKFQYKGWKREKDVREGFGGKDSIRTHLWFYPGECLVLKVKFSNWIVVKGERVS